MIVMRCPLSRASRCDRAVPPRRCPPGRASRTSRASPPERGGEVLLEVAAQGHLGGPHQHHDRDEQDREGCPAPAGRQISLAPAGPARSSGSGSRSRGPSRSACPRRPASGAGAGRACPPCGSGCPAGPPRRSPAAGAGTAPGPAGQRASAAACTRWRSGPRPSPCTVTRWEDWSIATGPAMTIDPALTAGELIRRTRAFTRSDEFLRREGLGQVVVRAEAQAPDAVRLLPPGGQQDDADIPGLFPLAAAPPGHRTPTHPGSMTSRITISGRSSWADFRASGPLRGGGDPVARLGQMVGHQGRDVRLIVHHENAMSHGIRRFGSARSGLRTRRARSDPGPPGAGCATGSARRPDAARPAWTSSWPRASSTGAEQPAPHVVARSQPIEDELGDRRVTHQIELPQHLQVPGHGRLGNRQHRLQVGHEQGRRRQAVEDPEPGRLGDGHQQVGGGDRGAICG